MAPRKGPLSFRAWEGRVGHALLGSRGRDFKLKLRWRAWGNPSEKVARVVPFRPTFLAAGFTGIGALGFCLIGHSTGKRPALTFNVTVAAAGD